MRPANLAVGRGRRRSLLWMPPELLSTDYVMRRWALSVGSGLPTEVWDDALSGRLDPLDDATAIVVDRIVMKSPPRKVRRVIVTWYRTPVPPVEIAKRLRVEEWQLPLRLTAALCYMSLNFKESGHNPLVRLTVLGA